MEQSHQPIMNAAFHTLASRCFAQRPERVRAIAAIANSAAITEMPVGSEATRTLR